MHWLYDRVAGQIVERLAGLSDGILAVAMTLLVLDLHAPPGQSVHSERELWRVVVTLSPRLLIISDERDDSRHLLVGQQTQLNHFARSNRNLAWIHIAFLYAVCLVPFSTSLLAKFMKAAERQGYPRGAQGTGREHPQGHPKLALRPGHMQWKAHTNGYRRGSAGNNVVAEVIARRPNDGAAPRGSLLSRD